jgi:hypothetical protein
VGGAIALKKAHEEYGKFHCNELTRVNQVEQHFIEAEKEIKQIESVKKRRKKT